MKREEQWDLVTICRLWNGEEIGSSVCGSEAVVSNILYIIGFIKV